MTRTIWCALLLLTSTPTALAATAPTNLRCEWRANPTEVCDPCPEFYWESVPQDAYRLIVANTPDLAQPVWDTGKVESRLPIAEYAGPRLPNGVTHYWRAQVWDREGRQLPAPPVQTFSMSVQPMGHHLPTIRTFINFAGKPAFARDWLDLCFRKDAKKGREDVLVVRYGLVCTMVLPHSSTGRPLTGKAKDLADFCAWRGLTKEGITEDMFCHFAKDTKVRLHVGRESVSCPIEERICPGWDPRNDRNGDGMVADEELARLVNPEARAREPRESRIPIYYWGPPNDDFVMNVGHPEYQEFMATVHAPSLCEGWDGIYFDTVPSDVPSWGRSGPVLEYPRKGKDRDKWRRDLQVMFAKMKIALPDKMITGNGWDANPMVIEGRQSEGWQHLSRQASSWKMQTDGVIERDRRGKIQLIQYNPIWHPELAEFGPKLPVSYERDKMFGLATYLLAHGDFTYFGFGRHPYRGVTKLWFAAMRYDLGEPQGAYYLFDEVDTGAEANAESLLRNGGFESGDEKGNPTAWGVEEPVAIDKAVKHSGASSAKIASTDPRINNFHNWQYVTLKANTSYTLIVWAKVQDISGKPGAQVYPYEFDGAKGRGMLRWTGTKGWTEQRLVFTTGDDGEGRITYRVYGATGTVWFDDIRLIEGIAVRQQVFARQYEKALVLAKPYVGGSFGDDTAPTHKLPGTFSPLMPDGSLDEPIQEIALRNAEAAVLVSQRN